VTTWLEDTRVSYDTVAESYSELLAGKLESDPYLMALLQLFAELVGRGRTVADVGCGPGRVTAALRDLGLEPFGIDLSPGMIAVARREFPDLSFSVGSMTQLPLADASVDGVLLWYSTIHVPDAELPAAFGHVRRVLRPGGTVLLGFHSGDSVHHKTSGYGGHPMSVHVHRRTPERLGELIGDAGLRVSARITLEATEELPVPQGFVLAGLGDRLFANP
jgi:ubiquinone/menaquinone biosynthesis C-methylase UbiE